MPQISSVVISNRDHSDEENSLPAIAHAPDTDANGDTQCEFRRGEGVVLRASSWSRDTREETAAGIEVHLYGVRAGPKF
jgi:hypothetical protein